ncbi:hypothetical protein T484DRAFT_1826485, partial [Baffinella frigidus]
GRQAHGASEETAAAIAAGYGEEQQYDADLTLKPSSVSAGTLEKILFCGVAMRVMSHPNNARSEDRPQQRDLAALRELSERAETMSRAVLDVLIDDVHAFLAQRLWRLVVHAFLAQRLWRLVVQRARLPAHLRAVKPLPPARIKTPDVAADGNH